MDLLKILVTLIQLLFWSESALVTLPSFGYSFTETVAIVLVVDTVKIAIMYFFPNGLGKKVDAVAIKVNPRSKKVGIALLILSAWVPTSIPFLGWAVVAYSCELLIFYRREKALYVVYTMNVYAKHLCIAYFANEIVQNIWYVLATTVLVAIIFLGVKKIFFQTSGKHIKS